MEKENWIDQILESADSLQKATPDASLFSRIEARISNAELPAKTVWLAAASIAILILLNLFAIKGHFEKHSGKRQNPIEMIPDSNQLYQ